VQGTYLVYKARRVGAVATVIGLYLLVYLATTNNSVRGGIFCLSAFFTRVLTAYFYSPYLNFLAFLENFFRPAKRLARFLIYDAVYTFDFAARFITWTKNIRTIYKLQLYGDYRPSKYVDGHRSLYHNVTRELSAGVGEALLYNIPNNFYCLSTF